MPFATGASAQAAEELWWGERAGCGLEQPEAVVLRIQEQTVLLATQAPTLTMFAGEVSANGKVSVSGNSPQNSQIQYLFAAQKRQWSWVGTWSRTDGKSTCNDGRWSASQNPSAPMTASRDTCAKALQGKIAWNYSGDTKWEPTKLEKLCGDLTHAEPAICFGRVMPRFWLTIVWMCQAPSLFSSRSSLSSSRTSAASGSSGAHLCSCGSRCSRACWLLPMM